MTETELILKVLITSILSMIFGMPLLAKWWNRRKKKKLAAWEKERQELLDICNSLGVDSAERVRLESLLYWEQRGKTEIPSRTLCCVKLRFEYRRQREEALDLREAALYARAEEVARNSPPPVEIRFGARNSVTPSLVDSIGAYGRLMNSLEDSTVPGISQADLQGMRKVYSKPENRKSISGDTGESDPKPDPIAAVHAGYRRRRKSKEEQNEQVDPREDVGREGNRPPSQVAPDE